ncbi:RNA-directed DNA polymerase-like protein [Abeliophyllum distichum]|uniref:RNA-directed DNA polymerase-like protein n=1 Tax=Abeliophyllum distichum TaxID=126358 RepID=A0ABD1VZU9_9LAMI
MPFGVTNALATFCTMMNQVLHRFLDDFVVVYLDDIIIYSETLEEHVQHVRKFLLRKNELYAKLSKCSFTQTSISFLSHIIEQGKFAWIVKMLRLSNIGNHQGTYMMDQCYYNYKGLNTGTSGEGPWNTLFGQPHQARKNLTVLAG